MADTITNKRGAEAAARAALNDRIELVAAIGEARERYAKAEAALVAAQDLLGVAATAVREAFTTATAGGWTTKELKNMGLTAPPAPRTRKANGASTSSADGPAHSAPA